MTDTIPPIPNRQRTIDADHLNLLSIFHFVGAGLALLGMMFLLLHFTLFHTFMENPAMWRNQGPPPPPAQFFAIFKVFYLVFGMWLAASFVLNLLSGFFLRGRSHRAFSLVVGAVNCLHVPLGTVLGVFTIVVLMRESVRGIYGEG